MTTSTCLGVLAALVLTVAASSARAQDSGFPTEGEMVLDVDPMPGSKRIPNLEIEPDGKLVLEMWCDKVDGQAVVAGATLTIITGAPSGRPCSAERAAADAQLLEAIGAVTGWRRRGDIVTLIGPKPLRFRAATN